jgi:Zn-dependent protease
MIVTGIVIVYFYKVVLTVSHANTEFYWRFVFAFSGFFALIQIILIIFNLIPESPMSLIEQGKMKEAK